MNNNTIKIHNDLFVIIDSNIYGLNINSVYKMLENNGESCILKNQNGHIFHNVPIKWLEIKNETTKEKNILKNNPMLLL